MEFDNSHNTNSTMPMAILDTATSLAKILAATFIPLIFMLLLLTIPGVAAPRVRQAALRTALASLRVFAYGVGYFCIAFIIVPVTLLNWVDAHWDRISSPSLWFSGTTGGQPGGGVDDEHSRRQRRASMASVISHLDLLNDEMDAGEEEEEEDDLDISLAVIPDSDASVAGSNSSVSSHRFLDTGYSNDADNFDSDNNNDGKTKTHRAVSRPSSLLFLRPDTPMTTRSHSTTNNTTGATTPDIDASALEQFHDKAGRVTHPALISEVDLDNGLRDVISAFTAMDEQTNAGETAQEVPKKQKQRRRSSRRDAAAPSVAAVGAATGSDADELSSSLA